MAPDHVQAAGGSAPRRHLAGSWSSSPAGACTLLRWPTACRRPAQTAGGGGLAPAPLPSASWSPPHPLPTPTTTHPPHAHTHTHTHALQGRWPNVERWFEAMEARPAYAGFKSDHYTHVHDLPPQLGGCVSGECQQGRVLARACACLAIRPLFALLQVAHAPTGALTPRAAGWTCFRLCSCTPSLPTQSPGPAPTPRTQRSCHLCPPSPAVPEAAPFAAAIDGRDGKSWHLPLEPLSATSLEAHSQGEQPEIDRLQVGALCTVWGWWSSTGLTAAAQQTLRL